MKKDFVKELTELINKHGLEKEMRDTPDYILAQVCVDAMGVFSEMVAARDNWHGFRQADEKKPEPEWKYPECCDTCKMQFRCKYYMERQPIKDLIEHLKSTKDKKEQSAIFKILNEVLSPNETESQKRVDEMIIEAAKKMGKCPGEVIGFDIMVLKVKGK